MKFLVVGLAASIFSLSLQAQDSAPMVGGCGAAMPDTPEVKAAKERILGQLLALVPDVVATYGEQKVVKGEEIRSRLRSFLAALDYTPALQAQAPTPAMVENVTYAARSLASQMIERELMLAAAAQDGCKPELPASPASETGTLSPETARTRADDAAIQKWIAAKIQPLVATEARLQQYYDEHRAELETRSIAQILVSPKKDAKSGEVSEAAKSEAKAKAKAAALLARIRAGEDFETLAQKCSDCPSAKQNGDLGRYTREESPFPPEFNDVAFALKDNEVSDLVETHYGYHLVKVTNVDATMSEEVREEVVAELVRAAVRAKKRELMQAAKVQFKI